MKKYILLLIVPFLSFSQDEYIPQSQRDSEKSADDYFEKAADSFNDGEYKLTVDYLTKCLRTDPKNSVAYYYRGKAHYYLKNYDDALLDFTSVVKLEEEYLKEARYMGVKLELEYLKEAHYMSGKANVHLDNYENAFWNFTEAIKIDSYFGKAYRARGTARALRGDPIPLCCIDWKKACELGSNCDHSYSYNCEEIAWSIEEEVRYEMGKNIYENRQKNEAR